MIYSKRWIKINIALCLIKHCIWVLFISLGWLNEMSGQSEPTAFPNTSSTVVVNDSIGNDSILPKVNTFKTIFSGKPGRAALYSLILPSGGQIYNKKWWKVPIALGIDGALIYNLSATKKVYNKFDRIVINYQNGNKDPVYSLEQAKNYRAQLRTSVENAWVYLIVGHLVTVFDAYVDRHLKDFDISPDLTNSLPSIAPTYCVNILTFKYNLN